MQLLLPLIDFRDALCRLSRAWYRQFILWTDHTVKHLFHKQYVGQLLRSVLFLSNSKHLLEPYHSAGDFCTYIGVVQRLLLWESQSVYWVISSKWRCAQRELYTTKYHLGFQIPVRRDLFLLGSWGLDLTKISAPEQIVAHSIAVDIPHCHERNNK